jgi:DNA polymerase-3 subunit delta'
LIVYPWLESAWQFFADRLQAGRLAHALLIQGPAGTGKVDMARAMARTLLCVTPVAGAGACGECRSCALLNRGAHPDWFPLTPPEDKHQITVDMVREATHGLTFTTTISARKVALIWPAESMNNNAANALLKCLEEPPGDTVIILVAHNPASLPVTIRSRCQAIPVAMPDRAVARGWLVSQQGLDEETAAAALDAAGGAPLQALEYAESGQVAGHRDLIGRLAKLTGNPGMVSSAAAEFAEIEAETLWRWLSRAAAEAMRSSTSAAAGRGQDTGRNLARLQQAADRNRMLARTAVRKDLLLHKWLIEWAAHGSTTGNATDP